MLVTGEPTASGLVPVLRYRDVGAAADWLCRAFGFVLQRAVADDDGTTLYALLGCGTGLVMLVPVGRSDLDRLMCQPEEAGGLETQACYVAVADADAHYAAAREAGAETVLDLTRDETGRAGYTCRDLEGHLWSFGTFDPGVRVGPPAAPEAAASSRAGNGERSGARPSRARTAMVLLSLAAVAGLSAAYMTGALDGLADATRGLVGEAANGDTASPPSRGWDQSPGARSLKAEIETLNRDLEAERRARLAAEKAASAAAADLDAAQRKTEAERAAAEAATRKANEELAAARRARLAAEEALAAVDRQIEQDMMARTSAAERKAAEAGTSPKPDRTTPAAAAKASGPAAKEPGETASVPVRPAAAAAVDDAKRAKPARAAKKDRTAETLPNFTEPLNQWPGGMWQ